MLDLCEMFDCRFIVVADRYEWKSDGKTVERSVEDIKERYYKVTDHTITLRF
jgi:DNA methyltransferase 1-associated protein 1